MRTAFYLALPFLLLLGACGNGGYYDADGNYVAPAYADHEWSAQRYSDRTGNEYHTGDAVYSRPGYYDYYGNYVTMDKRVAIPSNMLPPRGQCRVWIPHRDLARQPEIESCEDIQNRVPMGAYVIYGG
jgi:hypothetical protein